MKGCKINKDKKKSTKDDIGIRIFIIIIICAVIICIILQFVLHAYARILLSKGAVDDTWISSLASYWGGILGGLISGSLAYIGVRLTIRYYKESDAKKEAENKKAEEAKERDAVQPFIHADASPIGQKNNHGIPVGEGKEKDKTSGTKITFRNIGNGFAYTSLIYTNSNDLTSTSNHKTLYMPVDSISTKDPTGYIYINIDQRQLEGNKRIPFWLQFVDSKGNEYTQLYELWKTSDNVLRVECSYPRFTGKINQKIGNIEGEIKSE